MSNKVEIKKIVINIGDTIINLSLDQARDLQEILNKTFGTEKITYPYYPYPIWREYIYEKPYRYWDVVYSGTSNTLSCSATSGSGAVSGGT